jgi:hypothetical protein
MYGGHSGIHGIQNVIQSVAMGRGPKLVLVYACREEWRGLSIKTEPDRLKLVLASPEGY